jgi:hypothetical protein
MPRVNPQVEQLTREVEYLRRIDAERRKDPGDLPVRGCGDSGCIVARPTGMHTNGGCRCEAFELRRALQYYKRRAVFLEETIRLMKESE